LPTEAERIDHGGQRLAGEPSLAEEQFLQMPCHGDQRIFHVDLKTPRIGRRCTVVIQSRFDVVGQYPVQRQQHKVGKQFLFHAVFRLGVEVIDVDQLFGDLVQLLNPPACVIQIRECGLLINIAIQQSGPQGIGGPVHRILDQS